LEENSVHRGLVNIGQATLRNDASRRSPLHLPALYGPNITLPDSDKLNTRYYGTPDDPNGRKFYLHHRAYEDKFPHATATQKRDYVQPLEEGAEFSFEVAFENLTPSLLSGLVAALVLSDDAKTGSGRVKVRHKFGYGKPAGLGSVNIGIDRAVLDSDPEDRYQSFDTTPETLTGEALSEWISEKQKRYFNTSGPSMHALARVLQYPPDPEVDVTYQADPPVKR